MAAEYRKHSCRLLEARSVWGQRLLWLENEVLRVGVLPDQGSDIFEFLHKPTDTDFLWVSPLGLTRAGENRALPLETGPFFGNYHGGWQEVLPNCGFSSQHRGATYGLHEEVSQLCWDQAITIDSSETVEVSLSVRLRRTPLRLTRKMRLRSGVPALFLDETVENLSPVPVEMAWGHHPAFGAPFLDDSCVIDVPADSIEFQTPRFSPSGIMAPGSTHTWPVCRDSSGSELDLSRIPGPGAGFSEMAYLHGLRDGWYAVRNTRRGVGFGLSWPLGRFPYLWYWLEFGGTRDFPFWGQAYTVALEPWSSYPNTGLQSVVDNGTAKTLPPHGTADASLCAVAFTGRDAVTGITPDGDVRRRAEGGAL